MLESLIITFLIGVFIGISIMCILQIDKETFSYEEKKKSGKK